MAIIAREREAGARRLVRRAVRRPDTAQAGAAAAGSGVRILGTSPDSIDLAEDRERFAQLLWDLGIPQAPSGTATTPEDARNVAAKIGFPLVVRPSYVLGGRAMAIVYDMAALDRYMTPPSRPPPATRPDRQVPRGRGRARRRWRGRCDRGGRHRRHHGAHRRGRHSLRRQLVRRAAVPRGRAHLRLIRDYTHRIAKALKVIGLMNTQFAIKDDTVYVLEVNPRASRTVPYLSKATGVPLAKVAARVMVGKTLASLGLTRGPAGRRSLRQDAGVPVRAGSRASIRFSDRK